METRAFEFDRAKSALHLVGTLVFVVAGGWMSATGAGWGMWLATAFFALCAAVFVWQLSQSGPRLTISEDGLHDRTLGVGVIRWDDVLNAQVMSSGGQPFVGLALRNPDVYLSRLGSVKRRLAGANSSIGFTELSLNLSGLKNADPEEIAELVRSQAAVRRAR